MVDRIPGLDLLRAAAIAIVMLYHVTSYGPRLPDVVEFGYMGVDLFFVLSGFLIGGQLLQPYAEGRAPRWSGFFVRRAFRVLPAYLVVVALYFAFPGVRESPNIQPLWQFLTFTQNIFPDYFRARALSHAWSLCIEEHFYLLLPPIVWLLARRPGAGKVIATAIAAWSCGAGSGSTMWRLTCKCETGRVISSTVMSRLSTTRPTRALTACSLASCSRRSRYFGPRGGRG